MIGNLIRGAIYLLRGYRLILRPRLRRFFVIPVLINILVFILLLWLSIDQFESLMNWLLPVEHRLWMSAIRTLLWLIFAAVALLVIFFTFTLAANLIGSPFNGLLSEKVEMYLTHEPIVTEGGWGNFFKELLPMILNEIRKILYFLISASLLLLLSLVPLVNVITPVLWLLFGSWMLALEYMSYPMENHDMKLKQVKGRLKEKRWISLGFGLAVMGATLIPVVNFIVMPAAVAGATAIWVEQWGRKQVADSPSRQLR